MTESRSFWIGVRTRSFTYGTGINDSFYGATVTDKEGELLYTDVYNFADYAIPEKVCPGGERTVSWKY